MTGRNDQLWPEGKSELQRQEGRSDGVPSQRIFEHFYFHPKLLAAHGSLTTYRSGFRGQPVSLWQLIRFMFSVLYFDASQHGLEQYI